MTTAYLEETEPGDQPPEPEGDGIPGRSRTPRAAFTKDAKLVADDTEEFEEPQTGITVDCDATEREIYEVLKGFAPSFSGQRFRALAAVCLIAAGIVGAILFPNDKIAMAAVWFILGDAALLVLQYRYGLRADARKLQKAGGGKKAITVYPDRIRVGSDGTDREFPLNGTAQFGKTASSFFLDIPPLDAENEKAHRILIFPFRCIDRDILPYVEAMLAAGTRPFEKKS